MQFYDCWKSLVKWLDEGEITLKKYVTDVKSKDLKSNDENKEIDGNKETKEGDELHVRYLIVYMYFSWKY